LILILTSTDELIRVLVWTIRIPYVENLLWGVKKDSIFESI